MSLKEDSKSRNIYRHQKEKPWHKLLTWPQPKLKFGFKITGEFFIVQVTVCWRYILIMRSTDLKSLRYKMKRSSKGSSEKSSNGDESPNHSDESESPQRLSQSGTPTLSTQMTAFQSDNNSSPSIEIIPSNEEQVRHLRLSQSLKSIWASVQTR